jgi:hypothetical protein
MPFSLSRSGPDDIDGVGNYYVEVLAQTSQNSALTLYFLDSHSYSPDEKKYHGYDWIRPNQIQWFTKTAQSLKAQHAKYTHIHLDMAFIHIPLPEFTASLVVSGENLVLLLLSTLASTRHSRIKILLLLAVATITSTTFVPSLLSPRMLPKTKTLVHGCATQVVVASEATQVMEASTVVSESGIST